MMMWHSMRVCRGRPHEPCADRHGIFSHGGRCRCRCDAVVLHARHRWCSSRCRGSGRRGHARAPAPPVGPSAAVSQVSCRDSPPAACRALVRASPGRVGAGGQTGATAGAYFGPLLCDPVHLQLRPHVCRLLRAHLRHAPIVRRTLPPPSQARHAILGSLARGCVQLRLLQHLPCILVRLARLEPAGRQGARARPAALIPAPPPRPRRITAGPVVQSAKREAPAWPPVVHKAPGGPSTGADPQGIVAAPRLVRKSDRSSAAFGVASARKDSHTHSNATGGSPGSWALGERSSRSDAGARSRLGDTRRGDPAGHRGWREGPVWRHRKAKGRPSDGGEIGIGGAQVARETSSVRGSPERTSSSERNWRPKGVPWTSKKNYNPGGTRGDSNGSGRRGVEDAWNSAGDGGGRGARRSGRRGSEEGPQWRRGAEDAWQSAGDGGGRGARRSGRRGAEDRAPWRRGAEDAWQSAGDGGGRGARRRGINAHGAELGADRGSETREGVQTWARDRPRWPSGQGTGGHERGAGAAGVGVAAHSGLGGSGRRAASWSEDARDDLGYQDIESDLVRLDSSRRGSRTGRGGGNRGGGGGGGGGGRGRRPSSPPWKR